MAESSKNLDRWDRLEEIFTRAVDLPDANREIFIVAACDGDDEMLAELRSLLAADREAEHASFLDTPVTPIATSRETDTADVMPGAEGEHSLVGLEVGAYDILRLIGRGGMGEVYEAEDRRLRRKVALKFILPHLSAHEQTKKRFIREARAVSALDHPNICTLFDIGETEDGRLYIAMAFYSGQTLKELISSGPLPIHECLDIAIQITEGLHAAHQSGIVHRDLKPANLVITDGGVVKILDFGIAKFEGISRLTKAGSRLGTTAYMSPERLMDTDVDHAADLWSLGIVLYEMLTRNRPFSSENELDLIRTIMNEHHQPLQELNSDVPRVVSELVDQLLEKQSTKRPPSMEVVHARLLRILSGDW